MYGAGKVQSKANDCATGDRSRRRIPNAYEEDAPVATLFVLTYRRTVPARADPGSNATTAKVNSLAALLARWSNRTS